MIRYEPSEGGGGISDEDIPERRRPSEFDVPSTSERDQAARMGSFGMLLLLGSLTMLFAPLLFAYIYLRLNWGGMDTNVPMAAGTLELPWVLWVSTGILVAVSVTAHWAYKVTRAGRGRAIKVAMVIMCVLAAGFLAVQTPALVELFQQNERFQEAYRTQSQDATMVYGMVWLLIVVHAAHIVGGLIPLGWMTVGAFKSHYGKVYYTPVRHLAVYWHFLDVVWVVMYGTMLAVG